jgi:hypothetical protein
MRFGFLLILTVSTFNLNAANLIINGSFEVPVIGLGHTYSTGDSSLTGWTVTGACGTNCVSLLNSAYAENWSGHNVQYVSEDGSQHLDMTGESNSLVGGIQQSVATTAGVFYSLSFWVGNLDDLVPGPFALPATINLLINGVSQGAFTNDDNTTDRPNWKQFTVTFAATGSTTTLDFVNGTNPNELYAGLDNVAMDVVPTQSEVPEPSTFLLGLGAIGLGLVQRLRRR